MSLAAHSRRASAANRPQTDILPTLFGSGYGTYQVRPSNFVFSFLAHVLLVVLIFTASSWVFTHQEQIKRNVVALVDPDLSLALKASLTEAGGGGGGGDRDKLAASKGRLPKFDMEQVTPPTAVIRNDKPKLIAEQSVMVPPEMAVPQLPGPIGDPLSKVLGPPSNGPGSGSGIGSGCCGGIGVGQGRGVGPGTGAGMGGGAFRVGGGVSAPRVIYSPDPEYSEEARKAKYQGTVVLWVVVGPDGRVHELRVQRSLGLGLDEKAIEAVRRWVFEPAKKDGHPVAVQVNVEVNFHLY